jgi:hypothetical protein
MLPKRLNYETRFIAPVAQLDRVLPSEGRGHRFESCRARQLKQWVTVFDCGPFFIRGAKGVQKVELASFSSIQKTPWQQGGWRDCQDVYLPY